MKKIFLIFSVLGTILFANELDNLLIKLKKESMAQKNLNQQRETQFLQDKNRQKELLENLQKELIALQKEVEINEIRQKEGDEKVAKLKEELASKSINLEELFGVAKHASKDLYALAKISFVRAEYPLENDFLDLVNSEKLPNAKELELLWTTYLHEIIEMGKIKTFNTKIILKNGKESLADVTRVGGFTLFSDGKFLNFNEDTEELTEYQKQPNSFLEYTRNTDDKDGLQNILIDPTKGSLLNIESLKPDIKERLKQAGSVGYVIIFLGIFGVILALFQLLRLFIMGGKIKRQIKNLSVLKENNPLGRVLLHIQNEENSKILEAKLSQAVLKEVPKIERIKDFIKLLAGVAPMLGLLGTVVGMIETFQSITLFGTGEPKLMAGGISQALITTVLGLIVAIPLLFLYSILNGKSQTILQIIYEQSAGLLSKKVKQ